MPLSVSVKLVDSPPHISADLSGSATVTVNSRPTGVLSGGATYCVGSVLPTTLSIVVTGVGPWSGTLSNGTIFSGSSSPISVPVPSPVSTTTYTIATLSDSRCTANSGDKTGSSTVTLKSRPTGIIVGSAQICGGSTNLTLTLSGTGPWSGTMTAVTPYGGVNTTTITVPFTSTSSTLLVVPVTPTVNTSYTLTTLSDANCTSIAADLSGTAVITVNPFMPEPVLGITNVCPYIAPQTILTYTVPPVAGAITYTWNFASTIQLVDNSGVAISYNSTAGYTTASNIIKVKILAGFVDAANKQIRVKVTTLCGTSTQRILYLAAQRPSTPSTIVPSTTNVCLSIGTAVSVAYTIPKVADAQNYVWTIPAGTHITHPYTGVNDTTVSLTFDNLFTTGSISVYTTNDCGTSANGRSLSITRNNPSTPGLISGPTNSCAYSGATGMVATYSVVSSANVASYEWTLPAGVTNITGQGTNSVSFTYPAGFTTGTVSVIATNGCGVSGSRSLRISTLNAGFPGSIDVINTVVCPNREYTYTIASYPSNSTSLLWTAPVGASIISGQGTNSIKVSYPGTTINGSVTVRSVSNCSMSSIRTLTIRLSACPASGFTSNTNPTVKDNLNANVAAANSMDVKVFPNPTTSNFNLQVITANQDAINVRVLDVQGRLYKSIVVSPYQSINIGADFKSGIYIIEARQGKSVKTIRVVKF